MPILFNLSSNPLKRPLARAFILGTLTVVLLLAALAYWIAIPRLTNSLVRHQLDQFEDRLNVKLEAGSIQMAGWEGVIISDFALSDPATGELMLSIKEIRAAVNISQVLRGNRAISSMSLSGIHLELVQTSDGNWNLLELMSSRGSGKDAESSSNAINEDPTTHPSFLRHFGNRWPNIDVQHATIHLSSAIPDAQLPFRKITTKSAQLASQGDEATLTTTLGLEHNPGQTRWVMPDFVHISAQLRSPLHRSTTSVDFHPGLELVDISPFPFLRVGVGGASIKDDFTLETQELSISIALANRDIPILDIEQIGVQVTPWRGELHSLRVLDASIVQPTLMLDYHHNGAGNLDLLYHLTRTPHARQVVATAKAITQRLAPNDSIQDSAEGGTTDSPATDDDSSSRSLFGRFTLSELLSEKAPQRFVLSGASVILNDERPHSNMPAANAHLELRNGRVEISHRVINSELALKTQFNALTGHDDPRGAAELEFKTNYRKGSFSLSTQIDSLHLAWAGQMLGPRLSSRAPHGIVNLSLSVSRNNRQDPVVYAGVAEIEEATLLMSTIADDPITPLNVYYSFEGSFDPHADIPPARLIKKSSLPSPAEVAQAALNDDDELPSEVYPPSTGAMLFSKGTFRFNGVQAEIRPELYGMEWPLRRPQRVALSIHLPDTPVQSLFDAVPSSISGGLSGTKMKGTFAWKFDVEIPLYEARNTAWNTQPELEDFELLSIPQAFDTSRLTEEFEHTIRDEYEYDKDTIEFERTITIPKMRPIPANWLMENTGLQLEDIDTQRREREWPPIPDEEDVDIDREVLRAPEFWLTDFALTQAADLPWDNEAYELPDEDSLETMTFLKDHRKFEHGEEPYGPYVYVPLHHISPWLIRAIMTTEDTSFFTHEGFNWYALKHSVEANLKAGRYVRGGSTISMQLAKNLYLDGSKVLSRKLQEAFLVWMMESVSDIPKERLMEIYLNIIEFGPGIFGIHEAAVHYFGKRPDQLTLAEVAWIVSIVPNPKRHHSYYDRGTITDFWFRRMQRYMRAMVSRDRATQQDYDDAISHKPEFYKPEVDEPLLRENVVVPEPLGDFPSFEPFLFWQ